MLRREFGISAFEAEHVVPAWEREMLMRQHVRVTRIKNGEDEGLGSGAPAGTEPLSALPGEFRKPG